LNKQNKYIIQELQTYCAHQLRPEEKWLINCIFNKTLSPIDASINNQLLEQLAISNGLGPLIYFTSQTILPDSIKSSLKTNYLRTLFKNTQIEQVILLIQSLFKEADIPVLFLKGSILAFTRYADSSYRPMSDVDVIVPVEKAHEAFVLLQNKGAIGEWQTMNETDHHLPSLVLNSIVIEIHTLLFPIHAKFSALNKVLWKETETWEKDSLSISGLSIIHHAFYIATHIYYNFKRGGIRLCWLYDLKMLEKDFITLDAETIQQKAIDLNLQEPLTFVGILYSCITGTSLTNWPTFNKFLPSDKTLLKAIEGFRDRRQQNTHDSYQVIIEQIVNAPTLRSKKNIIVNRLTKDNRLKGWALIKHFFTTLIRLFNYILHQVTK